jgi:hypothetical protein
VGLIVKLLVGAVVGVGTVAVVGIALVAVPTPNACTVDIAVPQVTDARARWDAFATAPAPASVTFDEGEATSELLTALGTETRPVEVRQVHFCADGTTQVAFDYPVGPITVHGLAIGSIPAASPLRFELDRIALGWVPPEVLAPLAGGVRDLVDEVSSFGLTGPVTSIAVEQGSITVKND